MTDIQCQASNQLNSAPVICFISKLTLLKVIGTKPTVARRKQWIRLKFGIKISSSTINQPRFTSTTTEHNTLKQNRKLNNWEEKMKVPQWFCGYTMSWNYKTHENDDDNICNLKIKYH